MNSDSSEVSADSNNAEIVVLNSKKTLKMPQILSIVAIAITYIAAVLLGNTTIEINTYNGFSNVATAMSNYELNEANSETVYNQMVTNGWVAKDLLENIGLQNASIIDNQIATSQLIQATNTLLTYGLGLIAIIGISLIVGIYSKRN